MRSVVEGMEELDDIVDVAFDEVCDGIVGNADPCGAGSGS